jgi:hypothetical protein
MVRLAPGPPPSQLWTLSCFGKNRNFGFCFVQFQEYFLCSFSETQNSRKQVKGHVPSFQFLGVCLQYKEINLVLSFAGILQVLHKTDGEEKWERGLL